MDVMCDNRVNENHAAGFNGVFLHVCVSDCGHGKECFV